MKCYLVSLYEMLFDSDGQALSQKGGIALIFFPGWVYAGFRNFSRNKALKNSIPKDSQRKISLGSGSIDLVSLG